MMYAPDDLQAYRRARGIFSLKTYGLLLLWLILALIQWLVVCLVEDARRIFKEYYYICLVTFALAVIIFAIFIFFEKLRFIQCVNFLIAIIIVELQIISTFALVVLSWWAEVLTFFVVAVILIFIFLIIGIVLPRKMDLTLDIAVLFIVSFIFLIVATFILMFQLTIYHTVPYAYLIVEIAITLTILLFVMYHGQTIHGNRFAEMRLSDFFLGSLILFHDFLIIYWLTFYWQIHYIPITANSWLETSTRMYAYHGNGSAIKAAQREAFNLGWEDRHSRGERPTFIPWGEEGDEPGIDTDRGGDGSWGKAGRGQERTDGRRRTLAPKQFFVYKGRNKDSGDTDDLPVDKIHKAADWHPEQMPNGVLYRADPFDYPNTPEPVDEAGEMFNDYPNRRKHKEGSESLYEDAKGKPKAGPGNPSIDFPLADHMARMSPPSDDKSMVEMEELSPAEKAFNVNPLVQHPKIDETLGKISKLGDQPSKVEAVVAVIKPKAKEPNLSADEMKKLPEKDGGSHPDWGVPPALKSKVKYWTNPRAEPLITANPQIPKRLPDFEKHVMKN